MSSDEISRWVTRYRLRRMRATLTALGVAWR